MNNRQSLNQIIMDCLKNGDLTSLNDTVEQSAKSFMDEMEKTLHAFGDISTNGQVKSMSTHFESYTKGSATDERMQKLNREKIERLKKAKSELDKKAELDKERLKEQDRLKPKITAPFKRAGDTEAIIISVAAGVGLALSIMGVIKALIAFLLGTISIPSAVFSFITCIVCALVLRYGLSQRDLLAKAQRFAILCGQKNYIGIEELSEAINQSTKKTLSDIKKMLKKGVFPQGHIDADKTTLMLTDSVYEEYKRSLNGRKSFAEGNALADDKIETELDKLIKEGEEYVTTLSKLNADIPGEVITLKLDRLVTLLNEIFACVKKHPEQMDRMHEVMEYYIPTVIKLVEAYREYDMLSEAGDEILQAKSQIEGSIDTINDALKKILNNLFRDSVWDVTTDASVLNTMLAQKGLVSPFKGKEN